MAGVGGASRVRAAEVEGLENPGVSGGRAQVERGEVLPPSASRGQTARAPSDRGAPPEITPNPVGLDLLLQRRSHHSLVAPGPDECQLTQMLRAALRVPDFRHLRPYRFLLAQGAGLDRLGQAMARAAVAGGQSERLIQRAPAMPHRAPLVIGVVAVHRPHKLVPETDQRYAAVCTVFALELAARALGFGAVWRSGWFMEAPELYRELGLGEGERLVGFLYVGTPSSLPAPGEPAPVEDPPPDQFLTWL